MPVDLSISHPVVSYWMIARRVWRDRQSGRAVWMIARADVDEKTLGEQDIPSGGRKSATKLPQGGALLLRRRHGRDRGQLWATALCSSIAN